MRHRKLGRELATFRHTLTWTFFATIIYLMMLFVWNIGMGEGIGANVGLFNVLFTAWYGIYVAGQIKTRLTLYEQGFILKTLFKEHIVVYREIRDIQSKFSHIESPGAFIHARIKTPQGRRVKISTGSLRNSCFRIMKTALPFIKQIVRQCISIPYCLDFPAA